MVSNLGSIFLAVFFLNTLSPILKDGGSLSGFLDSSEVIFI